MVSSASEHKWRVSETFRNTETFLGWSWFAVPGLRTTGKKTDVKEQREGSNFASTSPFPKC